MYGWPFDNLIDLHLFVQHHGWAMLVCGIAGTLLGQWQAMRRQDRDEISKN